MVYIIAEVGGNHEQDFDTVMQYIAVAAQAGANAVKFQTMTPQRLAAPDIPLAAHPRGWRTLRDAFARAGLPWEYHELAMQCCQDNGVDFLSTPFSITDAKFLVETLGLGTIKVASGDLTYTALLDYLDTTRAEILLSTGMATLEEIGLALRALQRHYWRDEITLLQCVSVYPCPIEAINLRAITTFKQAFPGIRRVGLSDHTTSPLVPALAVALGAVVIEKHLRLAGHLERVDGPHALLPEQFRQMVEQIRLCEQALGFPGKTPHALEAQDRLWARRGSDGLRPVDAVRPAGKAVYAPLSLET